MCCAAIPESRQQPRTGLVLFEDKVWMQVRPRASEIVRNQCESVIEGDRIMYK